MLVQCCVKILLKSDLNLQSYKQAKFRIDKWITLHCNSSMIANDIAIAKCYYAIVLPNIFTVSHIYHPNYVIGNKMNAEQQVKLNTSIYD